MASRDRSRSPRALYATVMSLPDSIQRRITKDAALMIVHEDFEKAASLSQAQADRSDLVQGMRSPRASDAPVTDHERNTWQAHFYLGAPDPSQAAEDRIQAKAAQLHRIRRL